MNFSPSYLAISLCLAASVALGSDAFFSPDGQVVTFISRDETDLLQLDCNTKKVARIPLPATFKDQQILALCGGAEGEALFVTAKGVFVHDAKSTLQVVKKALAENLFIRSLSVAPAAQKGLGDWMFVAANEAPESSRMVYYARKPGEPGFKTVFCRRTETVQSGVFTADGRFFFAGDNDLWEGGFEPSEDMEGRAATLFGTRIAPLAVLNTDEANGGSLSVAQVMVAGKSLYVRLGGHHMGELVRLPIPPPLPDGNDEKASSTEAHYQRLSQSLAKAQAVPTSGAEITVAAATVANGEERLFYRAGDDEGQGLYLWEKATGNPVKIATEPKEVGN